MDATDTDMDDLPEKSLLSLDDMVLSKIMKMLAIDDVVILAETCVRLAKLSDDHFRKYYSSLSWKKDNDSGSIGRIIPSESVWKHCGKHVKMVKLSYWDGHDFSELLLILANYCKNLEALTFDGVWLTNSVLIIDDAAIREMFSKLKRFELIGCLWSNWCPLKFFFGENSTLEHLSIINLFRNPRENAIFDLSDFSGLKKLCVMHCKNVLTNIDLEECFSNNDITSLTLSDLCNINAFQSNLIDSLIDNLHTFVVDYVDFDCDQLMRLGKLKSLTIHCRVFSDIDRHLKKLRERNTIEELVLSRITISDATVKALENFSSLATFRLNCCKNKIQDEFFKSLPQMFPQLQQFIYAYNKINDKNIVCIVKSMLKLRRLSLFGCVNSLKPETYYEIEKILINDWHRHQRPALEFIPPKLNTLKELNDIHGILKSILLRTDVYERYAIMPSE